MSEEFIFWGRTHVDSQICYQTNDLAMTTVSETRYWAMTTVSETRYFDAVDTKVAIYMQPSPNM